MALYPPILRSTQPAFVINNNLLTVYYALSDYMAINEADGIEVKIHDSESYQNMLSSPTKDCLILPNTYNGTEYQFNVNNIAWKAGHLYKIQARFYQLDNNQKTNYSEWSNIMVTKAIQKCDVTIKNSSSAKNTSITSTTRAEASETPMFYGSCVTGIGDDEAVDRYRFSLYNNDTMELIETSGWLQHINLDPSEDPLLKNEVPWDESGTSKVKKSFDTHRFHTMLLEEYDLVYRVVYEIETINGYAASADYVFTIAVSFLEPLDGDNINQSSLWAISGEEDSKNNENACIDIYLFISKKRFLTGNFILSRASEHSNYEKWEDLKYFFFNMDGSFQEEGGALLYTDYAIESGVRYKYAFQMENNIGYRTKIANNLTTFSKQQSLFGLGQCSNFEYAYLLQNDTQLKLKFNNKISSFKNTVLMNKQDTLGSRYPTIVKNGMAYYKEFPISGTISIHMDDNHQFFKLKKYKGVGEKFGYFYNDELVIPYERCVKGIDRPSCDTDPESIATPKSEYPLDFDVNLSAENVFVEKVFREKVEEFLNNGEYKLFKSSTEGNATVVLMNISMTPNQQLGRMIYDFSATAYEVADTNLLTLNKYNIIDIGSFNNQGEVNSFYITGQIQGVLQGDYSLNINNSTDKIKNPELADNIIDMIKKDVALNLGYGYKYQYSALKQISFEDYPKLDFEKKNHALRSEIAFYKNKEVVEQISYDKEIKQLQNQLNHNKLLQSMVDSTPRQSIIPIIFESANTTSSEERYVNKGHFYHVYNEDYASIKMKYTQPIVINYIAEVYHIEDPTQITQQIDSASAYGQVAGIFTNTSRVLSSYNVGWKNQIDDSINGYEISLPTEVKTEIYNSHTNIKVYSTLDLWEVLLQNARQYVEKIYQHDGDTKNPLFIFQYDEREKQWIYRDIKNNDKWIFHINLFNTIDIEAAPGTEIKITRNDEKESVESIRIGKTGRYSISNTNELLIKDISFTKPTYAIVNYMVSTVQERQVLVETDSSGGAI